ncbi:MAG: TonB-dependent receptor [Chitinophagaceae bacterium]
MLKKLYSLVAFVFAIAITTNQLHAQVTTSSITGQVKGKGEGLVGATVTAIHQPSGTKYVTITKKEGYFTLLNTRSGGPYQIQIEHVGYSPKTIDNVNLSLGEAYNIPVDMSVTATELVAVTVSAKRSSGSRNKTGASTVFSAKQLSTLPSISRSITDFTRLTPQANGNNFGGRDGRYNNLQVDGANLNNNFGLSTDPMPGGGASPVSIDAYDEVSVNIAPYDVRQSGFTGAGINAVTKSGTNTFHGTAYGFYRDQSFNGTHVGSTTLTVTPQTTKVVGGSLGGPIIKNKLFFFINAEYENTSAPPPGTTYRPAGSTASGQPSAAPVDSLKKFASILKTKYNYDAGAYENIPNFVTKNHKILAKINWNINNQHKLILKYSDFKGSDQSLLNGSSIPNSGAGAVSIRGQSGTFTRLPNNRNSDQSIGFSNSNYGTDHIVRTGTLELNSNFSSRISNQLLLSYTKISDIRNSPGGFFPTIEIFDADGTVPGVTKGRNYMSAGTDPFTRNNQVVNNIATITDNFTYFAGKHTLTAGATYEYQKVGNMFMGGSESYYIYNSLDDFANDRTPAYFSYTYSLVPGQPQVFSANLKLGQLGFYAQDEINVSPNFKLTLGLRADVPTYLEQPRENAAITALQLPNKDGVLTSFNTGKWPKARMLFSPRIGFRWTVPDEDGLVLRGGTGIFTGKIPFVFLTNMPSNSGVYQNGAVLNTAAQLAGITFNPNMDAYVGKFPSTITSTAPSSFVVINPNFKFPQVFRTNLGLDKQLGNGFVATVDLLYTKDINAVKMRNANLKDPSAKFTGADSRGYFPSSATLADKYVLGKSTTAIVLENTNKGFSFAGTVQIAKSFANGFYGSVAYTYTLAQEVSPNPGSQATSAWQSIINVGTPNSVEMANSAYAIPHRIIANASYRFEYAKHFASTISLFYEGAKQANYSYIIGGDINNDGNNASDLMYIYKTGAEVPFVDFMSGATVKYTIAQQQAAYDQLVANTPYLKKYAGTYADRNGALTPWYNRLDMRYLQDIFIQTKNNTRHTLQFSVDILNLPNLLNKDWGAKDLYTINNPLTLKSTAGSATPTFNLAEFNGKLVTTPFQKNFTTSSTWGMQLGLRYIF